MREHLLRVNRVVRHKIGRRGAALLFFAELDLIYGAVLASPPPEVAASATNRYFATILPLDVWACGWLAVGVVCLIYAFRRYDQLAYICAIALKVLWGGLALVGLGFADVPISAGAIWISLAGLVWVLSGWREPGQDQEDREDAAGNAGEANDDGRTT